MKSKIISSINFIVVIGTIYWNYFIAQNGINGNTITEISSTFGSALTPASYAFSIWGIIFFGLIIYSLYYLRRSFIKKNTTNQENNEMIFLILANIGNSLWSYINLNEQIAVSCIVLITTTLLLYAAIKNSKIATYDGNIQTIAFVWWPIGMYFGWTLAASFANIGQYLSSLGFDILFISSTGYAYIALVILAVLYIKILLKHNLRISVLVGVWATVAIAIANYPENLLLSLFALICGLTLFILTALHSYHNKKTTPYTKFKEWRRSR